MKLFFHNDQLNDLSQNGSFAVVSRECNIAANELGLYADPKSADKIVFIDAFDVEKKVQGRAAVPWLMSEYNIAPKVVVDKLIKNNTFSLSISDQATKSFISAGLPSELIKTIHLGARPQAWPDLKKRPSLKTIGEPLVYITNNSSNNRSGYNALIPAFIDFAKGKNVKLIIKDQFNPKFAGLIKEIDKENKIIYDGRNLPYEKLVYLYNNCHINLYINSCTSFGLTIFEGSLCGLPSIVSNESAIPEFTSNEFVEYVECENELVNFKLLAEWNSWGLKNNLLDLRHYNGQLLAPRPKYDSIMEKLEYSYKNYEKLVAKNEKFKQHIGKEFTWKQSVKKIVEVLK